MKSKIKVIFFTNIIAPYRHDFFNLLASHVDLTVVYRAEYFGGVPISWHSINNFNYKAILLNKGIANDRVLSFKGLLHLLGKHDVTIFTNYGYATDLLNILGAVALNKKFYFEFDGLLKKEDSIIKSTLKKFLFKCSSGFLSPNSITDKIIKSYNANASIHRFYFSSVSRENIASIFTVNNRRSNLFSKKLDNKFRVLGVGQFISRKGVDLFFQVASRLTHENIEFTWIGAKHSNIDSLNGIKCPPNCKVVPFQQSNKIREVMLNSDIFLFPSREDVWGLVVNEALSCGLPVISSINCGASSIISEDVNGFLVNPLDIDLIVQQVLILKNDPVLLNKLSENAILTAQRYTLETMAESHLKFFSDIRN